MKQFLLLFVALLMFVSLFSQTITTSDTLRINSLGQKEGLVQLNVKGLALDDLGYLWAGTEDGLHRYNGYAFKTYLHSRNDSTSINDDHIRHLLYTNDTLWIATNTKGINGFVPSRKDFFKLKIDLKNEALNRTYKIIELDSNYILFSTQDHFIIFNRKQKTHFEVKLSELEVENVVNGAIKISEENILLATNAGVLNYNLNSKTLSLNSDFNIKPYTDLVKYNSGYALGHNEGISLYNTVGNVIKEILLNEKVKCLYALNEEELIIGTTSGVYKYDVNINSLKNIVFKTPADVFFNKISVESFLADTQGNLWVGTEGEGLIHYNSYQEKFKTLKLKLRGYSKTNKISSFQYLKGKDSTLFIGASSDMLKYDFTTKKFTQYNLKNKPLIYTIVRDDNDVVWAGGFTTGLLKYNAKTDVFSEVIPNNSNLKDRDVVQITPLNSNQLLVATWAGGLYTFNINENIFTPFALNNEVVNRARCSYKDRKGHIWLGTDNGVYEITKNNTIRHYNETDDVLKLSSNRVFSITEDVNGNIWFGTSVGLTKLNFKRDKTTFYTKQKGLPNDFIYSVLVDEKNQLWLSTNYGLSVFNQLTETFVNYTKNDGLQNNEFNGKAGYKDGFGNFYFGGIDGVNIFDPSKIIKNPHSPKVYVEQVDLFNEALNSNELFKDQLSFNSNENVITFNYSALNFINTEKVNYAYKLSGFDTDWRPVTKERATTYTNLDPGNYTFQVKATNDSGVWSDNIAKLNLEIIPPWYKTLWFKIALFLFVLGSLIGVYLYKTRKLKREQLKLQFLVEARTKEITNKNDELKLAVNTAEKQKDNIKFLMRELRHRVKNNLQIVSSLLNIQSNHLSDIKAVDALKVAKNRILTISYLEDKIETDTDVVNIKTFTETLCNSILQTLSDEDSIKFKVKYAIENLFVSGLNTTLYGLILNEIITNTVKHAYIEKHDKNVLCVEFNLNKKDLVLIISDNGKGYSSANISSTSLGLDLVSDMVNQLNGTIKTTTNNGVKNVILIPRETITYA